jgi:hypothetical protein
MEMKYIRAFMFLCLGVAGLPGLAQEHPVRKQLSLEGKWTCRLDPSRTGLQQNWQDSTYAEEVRFPGTLEQNKKGTYVATSSPSYLNQTYKYAGAAWYKKEIAVPSSWNNRQVDLFLERTKATWVWIDGKPVGHSTLFSAPQVYDLTGKLTPGKHTLTIMVDNTPAMFPVGGSHALSEHTQTNWNGILGRMFLEAADKLHVSWVKVAPDVKNKVANVQVQVVNGNAASQNITLELKALAWNTPVQHAVKPRVFQVSLKGRDTVLNLVYPLGEKAVLWSEYTPALYKLTVDLRDQNRRCDSRSISFGLREFKPAGTQFSVNGSITFLRGKNESCVFPLTGYSPMDTAAWRKHYRTAKQYGINHYRFHSYTPPEAAFEAADVEGIYIQAELPNWADFAEKDTFRTQFQYKEGRTILDAYGNHPSFVLFTLGNELGGDKAVHAKMVDDFRSYDDRKLYAQGTNAFYGDPAPGKTDDFWVTMRTGKESPGREFDVRGSFATTEDNGSGIINTTLPSALRNFSAAIRGVKLPVIGHEIGQYQIYPDYTETSRYTGVLRPLNFGIFQKRLQQAGMADQARDFFKASGKLAALLYREEIEMAFRTPGFAGFQLLDLQDFPGQGTALVGLLNAFMENKGLITPAEFRQFNNDVVVQLLLDKYTWTNKETLQAPVQLVNYSPADIVGKELKWSVVAAGTNRPLATGKLPVALAGKGRINPLGQISFPLHKLSRAVKLLVQLEVAGTACKSEYPVWVYPHAPEVRMPKDVIVAAKLDDAVLEQLNQGAKVLLFPNHKEIETKSVGPQFISEFWNWLVFKGGAERNKRKVSAGTLGILTDPEHPMFQEFPTEFHTNWQWWSIATNARPLILDSTRPDYRPIVQVIDNIDRNHKLGMIFEMKVGKGSLLVSMANLPELLDRPEARQLYYSMLRYMSSDRFRPQYQVSVSELKELL